MGKAWMKPEMRGVVAARFRALAERARLDILAALRREERTVGELVEETGLGAANVSKHLQLLHTLGFVRRRKEGLFVYYALADKTVFQLCDLMCDRIEADIKSRRRRLAG